jgi:hypothetical protein
MEATKEMLADGLTKALLKQRFRNFVNMMGMVDIRERLDTERPMEMKEMLVARRKQSDTEINTHVSGNIGVPICEGLSPTACC